jgi:hypothetical protein
VLARCDPTGEIVARLLRQLRRGDSAQVESERLRLGAQIV